MQFMLSSHYSSAFASNDVQMLRGYFFVAALMVHDAQMLINLTDAQISSTPTRKNFVAALLSDSP